MAFKKNLFGFTTTEIALTSILVIAIMAIVSMFALSIFQTAFGSNDNKPILTVINDSSAYINDSGFVLGQGNVVLTSTINSAYNQQKQNLSDGLVAHYVLNDQDFNVNNQTSVLDTTNQNNGTFVGKTFNNGVATNVSIVDGAFLINNSLGNNTGITATSPIFNFSNQNATFSAWIYSTGGCTGSQCNILYNAIDGSNPQFELWVDNTGRSVKCSIYNSSTGSGTSTININLNKWYHIVCLRNETSISINSVSAFVNGVYNSTSGIVTGYLNNASSFVIGRQKTGTNRVFNGSINNVQIYNRSLSSSEIAGLYALGKDEYTNVSDGLVAQYSGRDYAGTPSAPTTIYDTNQLVKGKVNQGFSFDGVGTYINKSYYNLFNYSLNNYSTSLWVKTNFSGNQAILSNSITTNNRFGIFLQGARVEVGDYNGSSYIYKSSGDLVLGSWNHITTVFNGTGESLYINNILQSGVVTPSLSANTGFRIGSSTASSYFFNGSIDDVRIYNRSLSADEIAAIYQQGIGTENETNVPANYLIGASYYTNTNNILYNATSTIFPVVTLSYNGTIQTSNKNNVDALVGNMSSGQTIFFSYIPTLFTVLAVAGLILVIALVLYAVYRFQPGVKSQMEGL